MDSNSGIISLDELKRKRQQEDVIYRLNEGIRTRKDLKTLGYGQERSEQAGYLRFLGYYSTSDKNLVILPSGESMYKEKAKEILSSRLVVGDKNQIDALHVLECILLGV